MHVLDLSTDLDSVEERLRDVGEQLGVENFEDGDQIIDLESINNFVKEMTEQEISIIIDGATLEVILENEGLSRLFFLIAIAAKSVICCRVSPKQKSKVVQLAKKNGTWVTLSIGDGANDVPMIQDSPLSVEIKPTMFKGKLNPTTKEQSHFFMPCNPAASSLYRDLKEWLEPTTDLFHTLGCRNHPCDFETMKSTIGHFHKVPVQKCLKTVIF
jgi:soluble P-type ATPase